MRILLTGGNGYIGTNLKERFGDVVKFTVCDYGESLPLAHELTEKEIPKENGWASYQGIIHLASLSGIIACENDPVIAVRDNILTAQNVFKLATKAGIPVVFTSSQAAKTPTTSTYAMMKWTVEQLATLYNNQGGNNYVIRLSNVYGGHDYLTKKQTCVKQFVCNYQEGIPLEVHGNGNQLRDFIHVFDVCKAIMKIFSHRPNNKSPMDIGTGKGTSIMDVVKMFPRKQNHHYDFVETRSAGSESSICDTSEAKKRINFKARRELKDYIKEMIENG